MEQVINSGLWVILSGLLFALFFLLHRKFSKANILNQIKEKYKDSIEGKLSSEAQFVSVFGNIENKSLFYKLDRLILTSGIGKELRWFNGEVFFFMLIGIFGISLVLGTAISGNLFIGLFIGAMLVVLVYVVFLGLSGKTYNEIEDTTPIFVSILSNHAKGSSDIVTIMQNTNRSIEGPIHDLVSRFLLDCERTGNVDMAFDYMYESVENKQLKTIIMNIKNCSHYQANYEDVLTQMMGQIAANLSAREERKNILFSMKLTMVVISIASILIVWIIGKGLDINVKDILTSNIIGQGLMFITGILYLFVVVKLFGTDK